MNKNLTGLEFLTILTNVRKSINLKSFRFHWLCYTYIVFVAVIVFGVPTKAVKDEEGTCADDINGPVIRAIKKLRECFPSLLVAVDVCLCAYTSMLKPN